MKSRWVSLLLCGAFSLYGVPVSAQPVLQESHPPSMPDIPFTESLPESNDFKAETSQTFLMESSSLSAASTESEPAVLGVEEGETVSGVVHIRPNPEERPGIRKVAYYLNGTKSGKVYRAPFTWGGVNGDGTTGFDTRTIEDGNYTLGIVYTDGSGDHEIQVSFIVDNSGTPPPDPEPEPEPDPEPQPGGGDLLGISEGETVNGIVEVRPNPEEFPGIQKVAYYLNGTKSGKVYQSPFLWGGPDGNGTTGFDTRTIEDGNYTLGVVYTDGSGDHEIQVTFIVDNSGAPPPPESDAAILGVENNETVSGTVEIRPNPEHLPDDTQQVEWFLNGESSGIATEPPFLWGGPGSDGTTGFDTRQLTDGVYQLLFQAPGISAAIRLVVENNPDPVPEPSPIPPSDETAGGLDFSQEGSIFSGVVQTDSLSFLADHDAVHLIDAADPSNPQIISSVQFFDGPLADIEADSASLYVLERGGGRLWRIDITQPSSPKKYLILSGIVDPQGLVLTEDTVYVVHREEYALIACNKSEGGLTCGLPFEQYVFEDFYHFTDQNQFAASAGKSYIRGSRGSDIFLDTSTPAPLVSINEGTGDELYATLENGTVAIYDTAAVGNAESDPLPLIQTLELAENNPVFSLARNGFLAVLDANGTVEIWDVQDPAQPESLETLQIPGAHRLDFDGEYLYAVTENEYRIVLRTTDPPPGGGEPVSEDGYLIGIESGAVLSGTVRVRLNPDSGLTVKKIAYYLNGAKSGKEYNAPFTWGGPDGVDTRTLPNGNYTLGGAITTDAGDMNFFYPFEISN